MSSKSELHVPFNRPVDWIGTTRHVVGGEKTNCRQRRVTVTAQFGYDARKLAAQKLKVDPGQVDVMPVGGWK